jgi:arylsulfatase A-like enzyme
MKNGKKKSGDFYTAIFPLNFEILKKCLISTVAIFSVLFSFAQKAGKSSPNIIYIYADDLGYAETEVYGQKRIKTPNINSMAAQGMRFTQHYTGSPVCAPARCILMTGKHAGHSYIRGNYELGGFADDQEGGQMPLPSGTYTIAHLLKQQGYSTATIGKWGLGVYGSSGSPDKMGFDYFYGYLDQKQAHNHYPTHLWENGKWDSLENDPLYVHRALAPNESATDSFAQFTGKHYAPEKLLVKAKSFIAKPHHQPFFLYLPITLPHVSLQAPASKVAGYKGQWNEKPYYGERGYASTLYPRSTYAAMVTYLDSIVGEVFSSLKASGLENNTVVFFSSDNGATFETGGFDPLFFESNKPLRGAKQDLYEGGIRIPMIAWWPGKISAGSESPFISGQVDMMATLADICGAKRPETDGVSLLPIFKGEKYLLPKRDYLYFEFPEKGGQLAIRKERWKAVKKDMKKNRSAEWELYDLSADLSEQNNLAAKYPELLKQFDSIVLKEHQHAHIKEWEFVDPRF